VYVCHASTCNASHREAAAVVQGTQLAHDLLAGIDVSCRSFPALFFSYVLAPKFLSADPVGSSGNKWR